MVRNRNFVGIWNGNWVVRGRNVDGNDGLCVFRNMEWETRLYIDINMDENGMFRNGN